MACAEAAAAACSGLPMAQLTFGAVAAALAAGIPLKAVCAIAAAAVRGGCDSAGSKAGAGKETDIEGMEEALAVAAALMGTPPTVKVEVAKAWLREQGPTGKAAANLFGKLSKVRNRAAHPAFAKLRALMATIQLRP